jgi:hypothetical protein
MIMVMCGQNVYRSGLIMEQILLANILLNAYGLSTSLFSSSTSLVGMEIMFLLAYPNALSTWFTLTLIQDAEASAS